MIINNVEKSEILGNEVETYNIAPSKSCSEIIEVLRFVQEKYGISFIKLSINYVPDHSEDRLSKIYSTLSALEAQLSNEELENIWNISYDGTIDEIIVTGSVSPNNGALSIIKKNPKKTEMELTHLRGK